MSDKGLDGVIMRGFPVTALFASTALLLMAGPAAAELQLSIYGGLQGATDSTVSGRDPAGIGDFSFNQRWDGNSFKAPLYWGARATWWLDQRPNWGVSLDYTHAKVYAEPLPAGWETLEFTDGLNILTLNALYRFQQEGRAWTPYVGVGAGISVPHVEVQTSAASPLTFDYQFGGVALAAQAGLEFRFSRHVSAFTEYKFNYTQNDVDLVGGGHLSTDIMTHAVNLGLSFHWQ